MGGLLLPGAKPLATPTPASEPVTVLGPGNMTAHAATTSDDLKSFSERLDSSIRKSKSTAPTADSLTQLLVQSVSSGDWKLLEEVLRVSKERLISATVKGMPVHLVLPFLQQVG